MWISRVVVVPVLLLFPHLRVLLLWRCVTIHRSSYRLCSRYASSISVSTPFISADHFIVRSAKVVRLSCVCYTAVLGVRRTDNGKWNCNSQSPYSCRPVCHSAVLPFLRWVPDISSDTGYVNPVRVYTSRSLSLRGSSTPLSDVSPP
ncbi:hypothetical protein EDD16DRAFT_904738 [Pisolithus croceorrhizus]|nr:hypothetical protein EDD16DRAFT_904738 [Pisolithus croceorrhizus]